MRLTLRGEVLITSLWWSVGDEGCGSKGHARYYTKSLRVCVLIVMVVLVGFVLMYVIIQNPSVSVSWIGDGIGDDFGTQSLNICILMCIKWRGPPLLKEGGQRYRTALWFVVVLLYICIFICVCILYLYHEKRSTTERGRTEIKHCFVSSKSFRQQLVWFRISGTICL